MMHQHLICSNAETNSSMTNSSTNTLMYAISSSHNLNHRESSLSPNIYYSPFSRSKRLASDLNNNYKSNHLNKYRLRGKRRNKSAMNSTSICPHAIESEAILAATTGSDLISNITHSECILRGFQSLKSSLILCDVTLVAQDKRFDVHKVVMASCSDYFRSMFTGGMKESQQNVIELKAVSAKGLEKLIEIIYTSYTHFESHIELFDVVSAANHLQCLVVIDFCERSFVKRINLDNFSLFIQMAQLYRMNNALRNIDLFIVNNLAALIELSSSNSPLSRIHGDPTMEDTSLTNPEQTNDFRSLSYEQLLKCLVRNDLRIKEIDLFLLTWKWINNTVLVGKGTSRPYTFQSDQNKSKKSMALSSKFPKKINLIRSLMKQIRFSLISPVDIVNKVQGINKIMTSDTFLRHLVLRALNYHVMPNLQSSLFRSSCSNKQSYNRSICSLSDSDSKSIGEDSDDNDDESYQFHQGIDSHRYSMNINIRSPIKSILTIGGREINPTPSLHDKCFLVNDYIVSNGTTNANADRRVELAPLPNALSHMQSVVVSTNFLYVLGGCTSQCAHGESAVSSVHRYDPRLNAWIAVKSMQAKRAYFYACVLSVQANAASDPPTNESAKSPGTKQFIYAIGGKNREGALCSVERYDPTANCWEFVRSLPSAYYAHSGCVLDDMVYVTGGYSYGQFTADLYCYSPGIDQWQMLKPMGSPRGWHCMCVVNERLYVFGGCHLNSNFNQQGNGQPLNAHVNPATNGTNNNNTNNSVLHNGQQLMAPQPQQIAQPVLFTEFYSPKLDRWTLCRPMSNLYKEASCFLLNDFIYVLGGYNIQAKTGQRIISRYDFINDMWDTVGEQQLPAGVTGMGLVSIDVPWFMLDSNSSLISDAKANQNKSSLFESNMMSNQFNFSYLYGDLVEDDPSDSSENENEMTMNGHKKKITDASFSASKISLSCSSLDEDEENNSNESDYELKKSCKFSNNEQVNDVMNLQMNV